MFYVCLIAVFVLLCFGKEIKCSLGNAGACAEIQQPYKQQK